MGITTAQHMSETLLCLNMSLLPKIRDIATLCHRNKSIRELASASPESLVFPDALLDNASFTNAPKMSSEFKQLLYGLLQVK